MLKLSNQGRYKTIDLLHSGNGFEAFTAVNIEDANQTEVLIFRFTDAVEVRRLLPIFYETQKRGCDGLVEIFIEYGGFCVVFKRVRGQPLSKILIGADVCLRRRLEEELFCRVMELSCLPEEFCNAVVRGGNIFWQDSIGKIAFQISIDPLLLKNGNGYLIELSRISECILKRTFFSMSEELDFLDLLRTDHFRTVGEAYSAWRELCVATSETFEAHAKTNPIALLGYGLKSRFARRKRVKLLKKDYRY